MDLYSHSFYLQPIKGTWEEYESHAALIDALFDAFLPLVQDGKYNYLNFRRDNSVFENEVGDYILVVYDLSEKDKPTIQEILVEIEKRDLEPSRFLSERIKEKIQIPFALESVKAKSANP